MSFYLLMAERSDHMVLQSHVTNKNHYISATRVLMATKVGRTVAYFESLLTIKLFYALITWSCKVTWQTKIIYSQPECLWLQTWQNDNSTWWVPTYKVTSHFDHVVLRDHLTNWNNYIFTTTKSMVTKLTRMVIYLDRLLIIKSYKALIMGSSKATWQTKTIMSLLQECLWQPNLVEG